MVARRLFLVVGLTLVGCNGLLGNEEGELVAAGGSAGVAGAGGAAGTGGSKPETCWQLLESSTASVLDGVDHVGGALTIGSTGNGALESAARLSQSLFAIEGFASGIDAQSGVSNGPFVGVFDLQKQLIEQVRGVPGDTLVPVVPLGKTGDFAYITPFTSSITIDAQTVTGSNPNYFAVFRMKGSSLFASASRTIDSGDINRPQVAGDPMGGFVVAPSGWYGEALIAYDDDLKERASATFGNQNVTAKAVTVGPEGSVYALFAPQNPTLVMAPNATESLSSVDGVAVLVKLDHDLSYEWHQVLTAENPLFPHYISAGSAGVAIAWSTKGETARVGSQELPPCKTVSGQYLLTLFSTTGQRMWTRSYGGNTAAVALGSNGVTVWTVDQLAIEGSTVKKQSGAVPCIARWELGLGANHRQHDRANSSFIGRRQLHW